MSIEQNKAIARRFIEEVINQGDYDALNDLVAADCIIVGAAESGAGPEVFGRVFSMIKTGFPDYQMTIEQLVAEGDAVVVKVRESGTHQGPFMGLLATGEKATWSGVSFLRFRNGVMVESQGLRDRMEMMQQLGVGPGSGPPASKG